MLMQRPVRFIARRSRVSSMGFGKDGKGVIIHETNIITLGTLADGAAVIADVDAIILTEDFRSLKTEFFIGTNESIAAGDGPIYIGIADGELTAPEIAEQLAQNGPLGRNDNLRTERGMRPIWVLDVFGPGQQNGTGDKAFHGMAKKNLRWTFSNPAGWNWFAFNQSGGALVTGTVIRLRAKHFGVWVT